MNQRVEQLRRRGLALVMVLAAVALAALVGMAMLSSATLQAEIASSGAHAAAADYLAESGIQAAAYYLQRDFANAPASWRAQVGSGHALCAQNVAVPGAGGTFDIDVVSTGATDVYLITSIGRSSGSSALTRTASATVRVMRVTPGYGGGFGGALGIGSGNVLKDLAVMNGTPSGLGIGGLQGGWRNGFVATDFVVPASMSGYINNYGGDVSVGTYALPDGSINVPQAVPSTTISSPAQLVPNANNRGNVFYSTGNLVISGGGTYNATFIVHGNLSISNAANGRTITIVRASGLPAVVADKYLSIQAKNLTFNVNGLMYLGQGTSWGSSIVVGGSKVVINGALLMPSGASLGSTNVVSASTTVKYNSANVDVIDLTPNTTQLPVGLKFLSWVQ